MCAEGFHFSQVLVLGCGLVRGVVLKAKSNSESVLRDALHSRWLEWRGAAC